MRRSGIARQIGLAVIVNVAVWHWGLHASAGEPAPEPTWTTEQKTHWSLVPPRRPLVPAAAHGEWIRNPIDAFIVAGLESVGLEPSNEADRPTLIRRLSFDLTGLPPSPDQVDAFVADGRRDAYERLVDRLLASPQYGERWARFWLDLARYAESDGFKADVTRPFAWRYRDWVIGALNDDLPYDRFVSLQLAGDEIAPEQTDAFVATGFNRNWPFEDNNKVPGLNRQLMLEDMTDTTASVFLGLTVACARCHDHKYDPISQKDYYRFQALFAASVPKDDFALVSPFEQSVQLAVEAEHRARVGLVRRRREAVERPYLAVLLKEKLAGLPAEVRKAFETDPEERTALQEDLLKKYAGQMKVASAALKKMMSADDRRVWAERGKEMDELVRGAPQAPPMASGMTDEQGEVPPVFLLRKGNFASPGEAVPPGFLSVLASKAIDVGPTSSRRRSALAAWLTRPDHPLTARVMVNRLWQNHFGKGIVATPSDFGTQGAPPSHPELLDWLATEFIARGWSLKAMHRLMVTSATYRQTSLGSEKAVTEDPENALFGRMFRRRLEGEAVRDALLEVAGRLDRRVGGPSVFPDLPPGVETRGGWARSRSAADRDRRSLYVFVRRNLKYPLFDAFDAPDSNVSCPERNVSVNAPQALMLLNSELVLDQARALAGRVLSSADPSDDDRAARAFRLALSRIPESAEVRRAAEFLRRRALALADEQRAGKQLDLPTPMSHDCPPAKAAALVEFCHALVNLNEFVFVD